MEIDNICILCGDEFVEENPCCCDDATHEFEEDGHIVILHENGVCVSCCEHNMEKAKG